MLGIILYGISILFSPGPVTLVSLNKGLNKSFRNSIPFFVSIGIATYLLLILYGFAGDLLIKDSYLAVISVLGCGYMVYLSIKMFRHSIHLQDQEGRHIGFKEGFLMQFLNPKATLAALPIATMQFPTNNIDGFKIPLVSLLFLFMGILSPMLYALIGRYASRWITKPGWINVFNKGMAVLLFTVALTILYESF